MPDDGAAERGNAPGRAARRRLAGRRKALGLTQEALANLMGVERSTVVRWERGDTVPLPWMRPRLARALRVSAEQLGELLTPSAAAGPESGGDGADGQDAGSWAPRPRQLPRAVAGFTGRAAELAVLTKILDGADAPGTVVISAIGGTAGVGKTALAIQWAHQTAERFPDGQLYVNLRGYDPDRPMTAADALAGFLWALGVAGQDIPPDEDGRAARYRSLLAGRRVLVVLDNAGSAEQARPLLPGSPTCAVLVTSRDSLAGLIARDGAARVDLDLLPLSDAVRLLRRLIGDSAATDAGATQTLAERCCRLPLALRVAAELAIGRPGVPLADLAAELAGHQERLDLLDAGADPSSAVRAVFSWSCRHLDEDTARAFRLAGLHPAADFDPHAVAALTGSSLGQARRVLDVLARAHLVQPAGPGRYGMHDLLHAYARELAVAGDDEDQRHAALTRLFDYYLHTAVAAMDALYPAESHRRPLIPSPTAAAVPPVAEPAGARAWLDAERATLVAVTGYAASDWPANATRLSATLFRYLNEGGHYPEAMTIHSHARTAAHRIGDWAAEAAALNCLGTVHWRQSRYQEAADHFRQALALFRRAGDRTGQARSLGNLGLVSQYAGRCQEAVGLYRQAVRLFRQTGDRAGEVRSLCNIGIAEERQGLYRQAARHQQQSVAIAREIGAPDTECLALMNLGVVRLREGDYPQAADHLGHALTRCRQAGYRAYEAVALTRIGDLCLRQGSAGEATGHLQQALGLFREIGDASGEADALNSLGEVFLATGQPGSARTRYAAALSLAGQAGDDYEQARAHYGLGEAGRADGDADEAGRHWRAALAIYEDLGVPQADRVRARLNGTGLRYLRGHHPGARL
jgi:tetratricopeptide (TPR) repeat protein/transcriptional regulator with XRE-family HTH domain